MVRWCRSSSAASVNALANLDIKFPAQRIANILGNLKPVAIITSRALSGQLLDLGVHESTLCFIDDFNDRKVEINVGAIHSRLERIIDADPLCIINTSGSTGVPKGVVLSHRTIDFMDWVFDTFDLD